MSKINILINDDNFNDLSDEEKVTMIREAAKNAPPDVDKIHVAWIEREIVKGD